MIQPQRNKAEQKTLRIKYDIHWKCCGAQSISPYCTNTNQLTDQCGLVMSYHAPSTINPDNGLWPVRSAPGHCLSVDPMSTGPLGANFCNRNSNIFIDKHALENVVCNIVAILTRSHTVNATLHIIQMDVLSNELDSSALSAVGTSDRLMVPAGMLQIGNTWFG